MARSASTPIRERTCAELVCAAYEWRFQLEDHLIFRDAWKAGDSLSRDDIRRIRESEGVKQPERFHRAVASSLFVCTVVVFAAGFVMETVNALGRFFYRRLRNEVARSATARTGSPVANTYSQGWQGSLERPTIMSDSVSPRLSECTAMPASLVSPRLIIDSGYVSELERIEPLIQ